MTVFMCAAIADGESPPRSVNDGVFTEQQSARGQRDYLQNCSSNCHKADLTGGQRVPALASEAFLQRWQSQTLAQMFEQMRSTMPQTAPHSLSDDVYIDIIAFLLDANGLPPGKTELRPDLEVLKQISIGDQNRH